MHDYLHEQYQRSQRPLTRPLYHWPLTFTVVMLVALLMASLFGKAARNAAIDTMRFDSCYTSGC